VLCGAGSALWSIRLSLMGYLCELSNPLMNYRWYLMQTLEVTKGSQLQQQQQYQLQRQQAHSCPCSAAL